MVAGLSALVAEGHTAGSATNELTSTGPLARPPAEPAQSREENQGTKSRTSDAEHEPCELETVHGQEDLQESDRESEPAQCDEQDDGNKEALEALLHERAQRHTHEVADQLKDQEARHAQELAELYQCLAAHNISLHQQQPPAPSTRNPTTNEMPPNATADQSHLDELLNVIVKLKDDVEHEESEEPLDNLGLSGEVIEAAKLITQDPQHPAYRMKLSQVADRCHRHRPNGDAPRAFLSAKNNPAAHYDA
ncbi:hypothetical protein KEM55_005000 [Ascosphaera atra]|nr:hypothetical protein KEM55_005000 [Ascosphaera atra]